MILAVNRGSCEIQLEKRTMVTLRVIECWAATKRGFSLPLRSDRSLVFMSLVVQYSRPHVLHLVPRTALSCPAESSQVFN